MLVHGGGMILGPLINSKIRGQRRVSECVDFSGKADVCVVPFSMNKIRESCLRRRNALHREFSYKVR